ncbi:alpha/beta fold hydrolase [Nitrincola tapanii]|uniref:Alpha/beta fold hydrolase n=1 Tax=Nitrincola tapanii TaxID=1708751 RepID=A0A5A9W0D2_9GAMM|nr:alpha/beta fold hydrolase [Nitrincola tapanii]KAA0873575.1 alpha/beta fold hydrolase [Nitrincola tapanii]
MSNYYSQEIHGPYQLINIGNLNLYEGGVIEECFLAISTFGKLNSEKSNAILIPTWYSGTSKIMLDAYIGEGRALDPDKYFIIIVNQIGNGLSISPSNAPEKIHGKKFPKIRICDDVDAQHKLLKEHFKINQLELVVGGSMGAQQTFEWSVRYPDFVKRAAPIAGTAKNSEHDFVFTDTLIEAITSDPAYQSGDYENSKQVSIGLERHAKLWTVMGWSTEFFRAARHQSLGFKDIHDFIANFMIPYFSEMDPNNLLTMAYKWQRADVSLNTEGDLLSALRKIKAKTYVMPISHDMFFTCQDCLAEQKSIKNSQLKVLDSIDGHLGLFGTDSKMMEQLDLYLKDLLLEI